MTIVEAERKSCQDGVCSDVIMKRSETILKLQFLKQIGGEVLEDCVQNNYNHEFHL